MSMRDYARVVPTFWTRGTGKKLREAKDKDGLILAQYVMTCPQATMSGLFHHSVPSMAHETGLLEDEVRAALLRLEGLAFCYFDEADELLWVPGMAEIQVGASLSAREKKTRGKLIAEIRPIRRHRFAHAFIDRYGAVYGLGANALTAESVPPPPSAANPGHSDSKPPMPGQSSPNDQDQDQDQDQEQEQDPPLPPAGAGGGEHPGEPEAPEGERSSGKRRAAMPESEVLLWGAHWLEVYAETIRAAIGDPTWVMPDRQLRPLVKVIDARCRDRSRVVDFLRTELPAFPRAVLPRPELYGGFSPEGWLRWHNARRPTLPPAGGLILPRHGAPKQALNPAHDYDSPAYGEATS